MVPKHEQINLCLAQSESASIKIVASALDDEQNGSANLFLVVHLLDLSYPKGFKRFKRNQFNITKLNQSRSFLLTLIIKHA